MSDPISRLQMTCDEIDKRFGAGFAASHPDVVCAVMQSAASDWAAQLIARGLQDIAAALAEPEEEDAGRKIVPASELLRMSRP